MTGIVICRIEVIIYFFLGLPLWCNSALARRAMGIIHINARLSLWPAYKTSQPLLFSQETVSSLRCT